MKAIESIKSTFLPYKLQPEYILFYLLLRPPLDELLDPELLLLEGAGEENEGLEVLGLDFTSLFLEEELLLLGVLFDFELSSRFFLGAE